ncbi:MAG: glycosyltransferase [Bacteroidota bacterium]|nr:glycosyltransferase [Bacteroidota bacterium]
MKILVISNYHGRVSSRPEAEAMISLAAKGVQVSIMTQGDAEYNDDFKKAEIKCIDFQTLKKFDKKEIAFIRKELIEGEYDIIHLFNGKAIINGIRAAKGLAVKVVLYRGYLGNIHWWDPTAYFKYLHPRVDKIWCIAKGVSDYINRNTLFTSNKAVCIHKGHHPSWYQDITAADLSEFSIPKGSIVTSIVANTRPMKGIPYLIKSTYHIPTNIPFYLLLIGKGLDTDEVKSLLEKSPHKERIIFTAYRQDALQLVKASDIFVLSSLYGEATTKSVIEAMSLGVPPIITDIPGNQGLVNDKKCGYIVPRKDPIALANAIISLYENPKLRAEYGKAAKRHIANHFTTEKTAEDLYNLYQELISKDN